jgi:hypothetical protein
LLLRNISGQLYDLMVTVGPASGAIIASSRYRLLALMRAGDGDGAAREMEQHLGSLLWMRRSRDNERGDAYQDGQDDLNPEPSAPPLRPRGHPNYPLSRLRAAQRGPQSPP